MHRSAAVSVFVASVALAGSPTQLRAQSSAAAAPAVEEMLIDFESLSDARRLAGRLLGDRYLQSRGARFGAGAHGVLCGSTSEAEVGATGAVPPCSYPNGASGLRAGYFDGSAQTLVIDFDRPVRSLSIRVNLPTVHSGQSYRIIIEARDSGGFVAQSETGGAGSVDLAPRWPTTASISGDAPFTQIRVRALYDGTGEFLFDDILFQPANAAPLMQAIFAGAPPPVAEAGVVESQRAASALRLYSPARKIRARIDWTGAFAAVEMQGRLAIAAAIPAERAGLDAARLPVLLPTAADAGSLSVSSTGDTVSVPFRRGGKGYSVYGSRILTEMPGAEAGGAPNFVFQELEYGSGASFSVYGGAYMLTRFCTAAEIAAKSCDDEAALREVAGDLAVALGAAAEARP